VSRWQASGAAAAIGPRDLRHRGPNGSPAPAPDRVAAIGPAARARATCRPNAPSDGPPGGLGGPGGGRRGGSQGAPGAQRGPMGEPVQLSGTVASYNLGPRGNVDSLMIKASEKNDSGESPPAPWAAARRTERRHRKPGEDQRDSRNGIARSPRIRAGLADHRTGPGAAAAPVPKTANSFHEEAAVKTMNYARHGEVDGVVLDNGDFVHFGPEGAGLKLAVGQKGDRRWDRPSDGKCPSIG